MIYQKPFLKGTPHGMSPVGQEYRRMLEKELGKIKNMRTIRSMKQAMKFCEEKFARSDLICNINKKQKIIPNPSYSMMHALEDGFSIMMYSGIHDTIMLNGCVHRNHAVRLILKKRIGVIWH